MKIRTGFVSNSSSSSFLVWFTMMPQSVEELKALLFGDRQAIEKYDYTVATSVAAAIIWQDLQNQQPATAEDMRDELRPLAYTNVYERGRYDQRYRIKDPEQRRGYSPTFR